MTPFFNKTCSEIGEERDEFSPIRSRNKSPKGSISEFYYYYYLILYMDNYLHMYNYLNMYNYLHMYKISNIFWIIARSDGQLLPVLDGKALSQPMPHPSGKIVW